MLLRVGFHFTLGCTGFCGFECKSSSKLFFIGASADDQLYLQASKVLALFTLQISLNRDVKSHPYFGEIQ